MFIRKLIIYLFNRYESSGFLIENNVKNFTMKKLTGMTDFVLDQAIPQYLQEYEYKENYYNVYAYAKFLKKPLELGMFIPCDEDGKLLEEKSIFNTTDEDYIFDSERFNNYQEAKYRCLFEGFTFDSFDM